MILFSPLALQCQEQPLTLLSSWWTLSVKTNETTFHFDCRAALRWDRLVTCADGAVNFAVGSRTTYFILQEL